MPSTIAWIASWAAFSIGIAFGIGMCVAGFRYHNAAGAYFRKSYRRRHRACCISPATPLLATTTASVRRPLSSISRCWLPKPRRYRLFTMHRDRHHGVDRRFPDAAFAALRSRSVRSLFRLPRACSISVRCAAEALARTSSVCLLRHAATLLVWYTKTTITRNRGAVLIFQTANLRDLPVGPPGPRTVTTRDSDLETRCCCSLILRLLRYLYELRIPLITTGWAY